MAFMQILKEDTNRKIKHSMLFISLVFDNQLVQLPAILQCFRVIQSFSIPDV